MAPRGNDLTVEQKNNIVSMTENGLSSRKIACMLGVSANTVQKVLKRYRSRGTVENNERPGRSRMTDDRDDRALFRLVKENRRQSLVDLSASFNARREGTSVSKRTIRRRLIEGGYKRCVVAKRMTISRVNREARVKWCRERKKWSVLNNWSQVIFSDETKVVLGKDRKVYVWRKPEERYNPECVGMFPDRSPRSGLSAMFWGCITFDGVGTLTEVEGNINSEKYVSLLDEHLWPVIVKNFQNKPWLFQEDNCPVHRSTRSRQWKETNNINCLNWPSQSPDINIIENLWRTIKHKLESRLNEINSRADLIHVVKDIWGSFEQGAIRSLYETLPHRLQAVIKAKGHITKY